MAGLRIRGRSGFVLVILVFAATGNQFAAQTATGPDAKAPEAQAPKDQNPGGDAHQNQDEEPVYDVGPGVSAPRVTHQVNPSYRPETEGFRISGTVLVGLVVTSRGEPRNVHIVHSLDKGVDEAAMEAVRKWQFEPAKKGGQSVAVKITVEIRFHDM